MKKLVFIILLTVPLLMNGQKENMELTNVIRINAISPGVEVEMPISTRSTMIINPGVGMHGSNKNLTNTTTGITYFVSPFVDLAYKKIYNRKKRESKGKNLNFNSGNYWSVRLLTSFKEFKSKNLYRKDDIGFEFGPTWGIQRAYNKVHFLFDIGPVYYFDTKENSGFFPFVIQCNIGFNVKSW